MVHAGCVRHVDDEETLCCAQHQYPAATHIEVMIQTLPYFMYSLIHKRLITLGAV
jgi:hypothetical protein